MLIYGILYVSEALSKIKPGTSKRDAEKAVMNSALDTNFAIPGDAGFPLNQMFEPPRDRNEAEVLRQYIMQMRQELAVRLLNRVYMDPSGQPSKVSIRKVAKVKPNNDVRANTSAVVAQLPEAKVHGQGAVIAESARGDLHQCDHLHVVKNIHVPCPGAAMARRHSPMTCGCQHLL